MGGVSEYVFAGKECSRALAFMKVRLDSTVRQPQEKERYAGFCGEGV
jgi:hypothetical protein